jgi:uncharacterized protein YggT (Ycf19 family)
MQDSMCLQVNGQKLPWSAAVKPTEWVLGPTRQLIPPVGGVDISPIIWFAFLSFSNEILVGPQVRRLVAMVPRVTEEMPVQLPS